MKTNWSTRGLLPIMAVGVSWIVTGGAPLNAQEDRAIQRHKDLVYQCYGDRPMHLDLFLPGAGSGPPPLVVVVHGGGWLKGDREKFHPLAEALAARGYAAATIEYRLGGEALFPAAVQDCTSAVRWLHANSRKYGYDANRIAAVGGSAGGHLVGLVATAADHSEFHADVPPAGTISGRRFAAEPAGFLRAAIVMAGPMQLDLGPVADRSRNQPDLSNSNKWLGRTVDQDPALYRLASPLAHVSDQTSPMLFMAGEFDVPARNVATRDALRALGIATGIRVFKEGKHGCWNQPRWREPMVDEMDAFLESVLGPPGSAVPRVVARAAWGEMLAERHQVRLRVTQPPADGKLSIPKLNNPIAAVYFVAGGERQPLRLAPQPASWVIDLPRGTSEACEVVVETVGRPRKAGDPVIVTANDPGTIVLPAHAAVTEGETIRYEPQPHKNTVGYWSSERDLCRWHFYVERPGSYNVHVEQGCGAGQGGSEVEVRVAEDAFRFRVAETGHFQAFVDRHIGRVSIPAAGVYTLELRPISKSAKAIMDVRQLRLRRLSD